RSADGNHRWFLVKCAPVRDQDDRIVQWFGAATDIDDQKRLEFTAQSQQKWHERAEEASGIGLFEWEIHTDRLRCSSEWLRLYRIPPSPTLYLNDWMGGLYADDGERLREELRRCGLESGCREFDCRISAPDTTIRWITTRATAYVDDDGNPIR